MWKGLPSPAARYGVAVLAVALVFLIKVLLNPLLEQGSPFLLFSVAVLVAAAFGGFGPGVFATLTAAFVGDYFLLSPVGTILPPNMAHGFTTVLFLAQGLGISAIGGWLVSARQRAEESFLRAQEDRESLRESEKAQRFLAEASAVLASSLDYHATLANVAELAVPTLADWSAVDVLEDDGSISRLAVAHEDPAKVELARRLQERYPTDPEAPRGVPNVLKTGTPEMMSDIPEELIHEAARDEGHKAILKELGLKSYMMVPLMARGKSLGVITLVMDESNRSYGDADLELAEDLARRASLAVDNARLYAEAQEEVARRERAEDALSEIREAERNRMARELHDGVLQDLSYAAAAIEVTRMKAEGTGLEEELGREMGDVRQAVKDLREAIYDLGPYRHRDQSPGQLLESLVELNRRRTPEMTMDLSVEAGFFESLSEREGMEVLRIAQEALTNCRRHSGAEGIDVSLTVSEHELVMEVTDDGNGFDPEIPYGVGFRSMIERARALGGKLETESEPGKGTRVRLRAPRQGMY